MREYMNSCRTASMEDRRKFNKMEGLLRSTKEWDDLLIAQANGSWDEFLKAVDEVLDD